MNKKLISNSSYTLIFIISAFLYLVLSINNASAACSDPAKSKVDWKRCDLTSRVLKNKDLSEANLRESRFIRSILDGSNLSNSDSIRAKFINISAIKSNFSNAKLIGSDFTKAKLDNSSFKNADMRRSRLFRATFINADLTGARLEGADLLKADFSGATWIDGKTICAEGSIGQCQ